MKWFQMLQVNDNCRVRLFDTYIVTYVRSLKITKRGIYGQDDDVDEWR